MPENVSIQDAERIRKSLGLDEYQFSNRLGYSFTAYKVALRRKSLSRWMAREISTRYGRILAEVRK